METDARGTILILETTGGVEFHTRRVGSVHDTAASES